MLDMTSSTGRSKLFSAMRRYFDDHGYTEVDTPVLSPDLIPEPTIENFATTFTNEFIGNRELYLVPSPEVYMKRLIAQGSGSIYQFSHCFRNCEQLGRHHNPEFTMLEYYTVGADDEDSIGITEDMVARTALPGCPEHLLPPFRKMTVAEACKIHAGVDLDKSQNQRTLREEAVRLGLHVPDAPESWEETFNRIFLTFVEPALPQDRPLVLSEYPAQIDCLAKKIPGRPYRRRWEMYMGGVEVANCYDEERDASTVREYYRKEYAALIEQREKTGTVIPDIDLSFADCFESDFPPCSGVAMGMDRMLMLQLGKTSIEGVILFPFSVMMADR